MQRILHVINLLIKILIKILLNTRKQQEIKGRNKMSSRVNYKYEDEDLNERSFEKEEKYGQSSSPYRLIDEPSGEFSFKQISQNRSQILDGSRSLYKSQSITSLKQNLQQLPKSEIIELLIQQINFSQSNPSQRIRLNQTLKQINRPKDSSSSKKEEPNFKKKYDQLVRDFQQYINNTRQAQEHYVKIIQDLKRQNKSLQSQLNKKPKESHYSPNYSPRSHNNKSSLMVEKLQQSVQNYIKINNQLIGKVQRLERINKQNSEETLKLKQENEFLKQDNQFMMKEVEKLKKQNISFKSIVDELKDYIMERRQAKEQVSNNSDTQRQNIPQKSEMGQQEQKYQNDSIIQSSQIKRRQLTLNDSTLMFQKDSNTISNLQYQERQQKRYQKIKQIQYIQDDSQDYQKITETLKMVQAQNKVLKITNQKLENLLQKKSQKVKIMLQEIETLKTQNDIVNEEIIQLKSKIKKGHVNSHNESTTASKSSNQDYKLNMNKQEMYAKSQYLKDSLSQAFSKRYSHCTQSQVKKRQDSIHNQIQEQNKNQENRQRKTFNLESFNLLKGQAESKPVAYQEKHLQKNPEQYYIPRTLITSNKKF